MAQIIQDPDYLGNLSDQAQVAAAAAAVGEARSHGDPRHSVKDGA